SRAEFQRRGPYAGPVVFRQGPGDVDGGSVRRGRGAGARDGEIPGAVAVARLEAAGFMHLPVFQPAGGAVQAPLGDVASGGVAGAVAVATGVPGAAGDGESGQVAAIGTAGTARRVGAGASVALS